MSIDRRDFLRLIGAIPALSGAALAIARAVPEAAPLPQFPSAPAPAPVARKGTTFRLGGTPESALCSLSAPAPSMVEVTCFDSVEREYRAGPGERRVTVEVAGHSPWLAAYMYSGEAVDFEIVGGAYSITGRCFVQHFALLKSEHLGDRTELELQLIDEIEWTLPE